MLISEWMTAGRIHALGAANALAGFSAVFQRLINLSSKKYHQNNVLNDYCRASGAYIGLNAFYFSEAHIYRPY